MTDGWVKLHRNIADNPVFHDAHLFKIFTWCVIRANASNQIKEVYGSKVKKGEFVTGKLSASAELHMKPSTVYDRLKKLEAMKVIEIKSNTKHSVIKVKNFNRYQAQNGSKTPISLRLSNFKQSVMETDVTNNLDCLEAFILYWSELNRSKTQMRFELQPTWDVKRRLTTWVKNNDKYQASTGGKKSSVETIVTNWNNTIDNHEAGQDIF
tara:strand:+ start:1038 stop:1667 length:630 start_codon:yes stop_codon:yes gene_type:complete